MPLVAAVDAVEVFKTGIVNPLLKLLLVVSVLYFLWGVVQFMTNREDAEKKKHMLWGTIGLVIVVGAFGIVNLIGSFVETVAGK
ncbi:MAG TPA: hypothetical protein VJI73_01335 [Candidatus Paceibacterota bacterium]